MRTLQTKHVWGLAREYKSRSKSFPLETPTLILWENNIDPTQNIHGTFYPSDLSILIPRNDEELVSIVKNDEDLKNNFVLTVSPKIFPNVPELFPESMKEEMDYYLEKIEELELKKRNFVAFIPDQLVETDYFKKLQDLHPTIIFIRFSFDWKKNPKRFFKLILHARLNTPADIALGMGGIIEPFLYAPLIYLGFDVIDGSWIRWVTSLNLLYYKHKLFNARTSFVKSLLEENNKTLLEWNTSQAKKELLFVKESLSDLSLRDYLEELVYATPIITSFLREEEKVQNIYLNDIPITGNPIFCPTELSLSRPEITAFHHRIKNRYTPRKSNVVVILPCSHKKPYFISQSHQRYGKILRNFYKKTGIFPEKIIVTSPVGAIPGDLDVVYPVAHYDIPVTGDWSPTEIEKTSDYLKDLLIKYPKNTLFIVHTSEDYKLMIKKGFEKAKLTPFIENYSNTPYLSENLEKLNLSLQQAKSNLTNIVSEKISGLSPSKIEYIHRLRALANYQYGAKVGDKIISLYKDINVRGKYPRDVAFYSGKTKIGILSFSTNKLVLTISVLKEVLSYVENRVIFDGTEITGSSIFLQGVKKADPSIRPGDEVVIFSNDNNFLATGTAILSGRLMNLGGTGVAIKIRQKVK